MYMPTSRRPSGLMRSGATARLTGARLRKTRAASYGFGWGGRKPFFWLPSLSDLSGRLQAMANRGIEHQVLSPPLTFVGYQLEERQGQALSRLFNETNTATARAS